MTQEEFARKGGLGPATIQRIEKGEIEPRATTLNGLDRAALWPTGTARSIYKEGAATPSRTGPKIEAPAPREFTAVERERILSMTMSEIFAMAERLEQTSEQAAWLWVIEAGKIKLDRISQQPDVSQTQ